MDQLTTEQFSRFSTLIYKKLGLSFDEKKLSFIEKRLHRRLEELDLDDLGDYYFKLAHCDPAGKEMQELANLITTNETYMFREFEQLEAFANYCLPEMLAARQKAGQQQLRIWCAGCSTGEEAYTLAIIVREIFPDIVNWDFSIIATDLDETVLAKARCGVYGERSMKNVPEEYLSRHFIAHREGAKVAPETAHFLQFRQLNLHDRLRMREMRSFDCIFCRNVLIYFDDASRKGVVDHFHSSLRSGGYLFLGHSESVGRISSAFRLRRFDSHLVYSKD